MPTLEGFVDWCATDMSARDHLRSAIYRRGVGGDGLEAILKAFGCRDKYNEAVVRRDFPPNGRWVKNVYKLAEVMRMMHIRSDELIERHPAPFYGWRGGSRILVLFGVREARLSVNRQLPVCESIAKADAQAFSHLSNYFQSRADCRPDSACWDWQLAPREAKKRMDGILDGHSARDDIGAVVVLGSPATNPAAEPLAERILGDAELPAKFCWNAAVNRSCREGSGLRLSEPSASRTGEEGLRLKGHAGVALLRTRRNVGKGSAKKPFRDCGLLLVRYDQRPVLCLLAGHGAEGTLAATFALMCAWKMASICRHPDHQIAPGVAYALVTVTSPNVRPGEGNGWEFH